jgi:H-NS histone family
MKIDTFESLSDAELRDAIARANDLLAQRDRQRKEKAIEDARAILAGAGLSLKDVAAGKKNGNGKGPVYHGGHSYQHPSDKTKVWNAKGQKPHWLRELEASGGKAVELD